MTRPTVTTQPLDATETGHLTELLYDDGANDEVLVCAAHGGRVEPGTAAQAVELATRLPAASCWARLGYDEAEEEFDIYHPPSTAIDPADHPLLARVADREFRVVISLHGLADGGVLVGGGLAETTRGRVADRLRGAVDCEVRVVSEGPYAGAHPENFVNWLAASGGLQLEQGPTVRAESSGAVVAALADLLTGGVL